LFRTPITSTPLTTDAANAYFDGRIFGNNWNRDISFVATLRALLDKRLGAEDHVYLHFGSSSYDASQLRCNNDRACINAITDEEEDTIYVHNFNGTPENNEAWFNFVEANIERHCPGWHRLEKATMFYRKVFKVLCYINPEKHNVMLFADSLDTSRMHYLQCGIFAFMPWYFDQKDAVDELEMELVKSLRAKTPDKYLDCLAKIAAQYDFKTARVRQLLAGFETRYERAQCEDLRYRIESSINSINDLNDRISSYLRQKKDYEIQLLGYETKIAQSEGQDSEIMEYFLCNKNIILEDVDDARMQFVVCDYVSFFDDEMLRRVLDNPTSYIYRVDGRDRGNIIPADDMKMLMKAIFLDETIKMRFCAAYEFNLAGGVHAISSYSYPDECRDYTPNTHIDRFHCMGGYEKIINERLRDHDYIGAISQCIASCKSLNFGDSPVMNEFMRRMYEISDRNVNIRCIELPDGSVVKPKDAIKYLKEAAANG